MTRKQRIDIVLDCQKIGRVALAREWRTAPPTVNQRLKHSAFSVKAMERDTAMSAVTTSTGYSFANGTRI